MNSKLSKSDYLGLVRQLIGQENNISVPKILIKFFKNANHAIVFSQLLFWSDKTTRIDGYFYKCAGELEQEIGFSKDQIYRSVKYLSDKYDFIEYKVVKANGKPTRHFKICLETCLQAISSLVFADARIGNRGSANSEIADPRIDKQIRTTDANNRSAKAQDHDLLKNLKAENLTLDEEMQAIGEKVDFKGDQIKAFYKFQGFWMERDRVFKNKKAVIGAWQKWLVDEIVPEGDLEVNNTYQSILNKINNPNVMIPSKWSLSNNEIAAIDFALAEKMIECPVTLQNLKRLGFDAA